MAGSAASRKRIVKKKAWNRYGVSEIIGTLLILAMTVALFSGILWYVASMPTPTQNVYGNFAGSVDFKTGSYCDITIKHLGGETLSDSVISIYVLTDTAHMTLKISDSDPSLGSTWSMGNSWHYNTTTDAPLLALNSTSNLEVMIVDTAKNVIVWDGTLLDNGASSSIPVICDRYLASKVSDEIWLEATSFKDKQAAAMFVNVLDSGNDVAHVYADVSELGGPSNLELIDVNGDGWYSMDFQIVSAIGIKYIGISAIDAAGRMGTSSLAVDIYSSTSDSTSGGHGNGSAPGDLHFSNLQGLNLFKYKDWWDYNYSATPTDKFYTSDRAVVVVASKFLVNTENANNLLILNSNGEVVKNVSSDDAFVSYDYYSGYYVYQAIINVPELLDDCQYYAQVQLRDSYLPNNNQFFAIVPFTVGNSTQPQMETYSDPYYTEKCTTFNTSSMVYVKISNAPAGIWSQNAGLVEIADYSWDMQVKRIPGSTGILQNPVSNLTKSASGTVYTFSINLSAASQSPWLPGNNSYMLRYDLFTVSGQGYLLSQMIDIESPKIILDLVAADDSASLKGGWSEGTMIDYYSNDNQWVPPDMIQNWDDKHNSQYSEAVFVRLANINSNGKLDVVAVLLDSANNYVINIYRNDGAWTPIHVESEGRGTITAVTTGALDASAGDDIIVGYSTGEVGFYRNDGTWSYQLIDNKVTNCAVTSLVAIDMENTKEIYGTPRSMYVVAGYSSSVSSSFPIYIWTNTDGTGINWGFIPYKGQVSNILSANATNEASINSYIVNGSYLSTNLGVSGYEEVSEKSKTATFYARSSVPSVDSAASFTVLSGKSMEWSQWNYWNVTPSSTIKSVAIEVYYSVNDKKATGSAGLSYSLPNSVDYTELTRLLPYQSMTKVDCPISGITNINDLFEMKIKLTNDASSSYTFQYWRLYVTFEAEAASMDHRWTLVTSNGGTNALEFVSKTSSVNEEFIFQYSTNGGSTYTTFNPSLVVASGTYVKYSANLPSTTIGTTFIIKVVDAHPASDSTTNTTLSIKNLCVNTTVTSGSISIGLPITDLEVYDMNNDGRDDLVIADGQNVWLCYNAGGTVTSALPTKITSGTNPMSNIISIGVGVISSQSDFPGVVVAAHPSSGYKVYTIEPDAEGSFDGAPVIERFTSSTAILKLVGGDIDNDGDLDFVISTGSNSIIYYRNDGSGVFNGWVIDTLPMGVNDIALGKIQNN